MLVRPRGAESVSSQPALRSTPTPGETDVTLLLTTDDAAQVISMETSLASLEHAFADLEEGRAADRPRARVYAHLGDDLFYRYSSMDASLLRYGAHTVRITS